MRIIFLSHYFPPEIGPGQTRVFEYGRGLVRKGHKVTVLTPFPNYPNGIIPVKYRGRFWMREEMEGLEIIRTYVYATPNEGFFRRILNHLSFAVSSVIGAVFLKSSYDVVNVISPPLFLGFSGYLISLMKKAKLVFEVRDLWPDVAVALGVLKNRFFIKLSKSLEDFTYKKSDLVTAATNGVFLKLLEKGVPSYKLSFMPAGVDVDFFKPDLDNSHFRSQKKFNGKFIVMYAGNHGLSHKLETLLSTAGLLREKEDIRFVLVGDGIEKKKLVRLARKNELSNVLFLPPVPRKRMNELLNFADICVASLKKGNFFTGTLLIKVFEYMACGKPVVAALRGETGEFIERSGGGIRVEPEDPEGIADSLLYLYKNEELRKEMGRKGRKAIEKYYSRQKFIDRMEDNFIDLINSGKIDPTRTEIDIFLENGRRDAEY